MVLPISRYRASRQYLWASLAALAITSVSTWMALFSPYAWIAAGLAAATSVVLFGLHAQPEVGIFESHLRIGGRAIPWPQIRRLDRMALVPLVVKLTLVDRSQITLVYAGNADSSNGLLRHLRRYSKEALIDGVQYREFWGEPLPSPPERKQIAAKRYPLLLPDDEAEVERLFQRLKSVGHIDPKGGDEK